MKIVVVCLLAVLVLVWGLYAYKNTTNKTPDLTFWEKDNQSDEKEEETEKEDESEKSGSASVKIVQRWQLPKILTEISDLSNINDRVLACVQDELGTIFLYNLEDRVIEREVPFAGEGDYEGVALVGNVGYVVNSSGVLYEVNDISKKKPLVKKYQTFLTKKHEVEALCYDELNNRLLLAFKAEEGNGATKGVYAFNLKSKELSRKPVFEIDVEKATPSHLKGKKKERGLKPSAITIHPVTKEIYVLEGTNPKLIILDRQGKVKSSIPLDDKEFAQPEGITFNSSGEMFISSEGKKGKGNILKVAL